MPIQRRLPKFGFTSRVSFVTDQVTLSEIAKVEGDVVSLDTLKAAGLIKKEMQNVKVILSGSISRSVTISGLGVTKGALEAITAAGGKVEE
jgi:large subunit ribosomal protein L15